MSPRKPPHHEFDHSDEPPDPHRKVALDEEGEEVVPRPPLGKPKDPVQIELKLLRQAYQAQGKALAALEQQMQHLDNDVNARFDGVTESLDDIKKALLHAMQRDGFKPE